MVHRLFGLWQNQKVSAFGRPPRVTAGNSGDSTMSLASVTLPQGHYTSDTLSAPESLDKSDGMHRSVNVSLGTDTTEDFPGTYSAPSSPSGDSVTGTETEDDLLGSGGEEDEEGPVGISDEGIRFRAPRLPNVVETFMNPRLWTLPEMANVGLLLFNLHLFRMNLPLCVYGLFFFFWRLCYNVGLGWLLRRQSNELLLTRKMRALLKENGRLSQFFRILLTHRMGYGYDCKKYPPAFNAWLAFRWLVDLVLGNDLAWYILFCFKCWEWPQELGFGEILQYCIAIALCAFSFWAKSDAHRVIGDYAWYWGDFFFLMDQDLTFDGIFQMFPHPMYTVGYTFFYGSALLTRSYTVLFVSLVAHFCQLAFLTFVEDPHIQRIYESENHQNDLTIGRKGVVTFWNLDPFRSPDQFLLMLILYTVLLSFLNLPVSFYLGHALIWRFLHTFGLGMVLYMQSKNQFFTQHFEARGETKMVAFENWKWLYNLSFTMNMVTFFLCALKIHKLPADLWSAPSYFALQAVGMVLIYINFWSAKSMYETLGDFGWFYGDFFIEEHKVDLHYSGVYRYLNNPDCWTGYLALYGLALMSQSWDLFFVALLSQGTSFIFLQFVEMPHMNKMYCHQIRKETEIEAMVQSIVRTHLKMAIENPELRELTHKMAQRVRRLRERIRKEGRGLRAKADELREDINTAKRKIRSGARRVRQEVQDTASKIKSELERPIRDTAEKIESKLKETGIVRRRQ